jgi:hypothetical protein
MSVDFLNYFKEEKPVFVQNLSNCQVSVTFDLGSGRVESVLFPNVKDPIDLTQQIPFQAIKNSIDFRKMLNRKPLTLRLLTDEEYQAHYNRLAKNHGISFDQALEKADDRRRSIQTHQKLKDAPTKHLKVSDKHDDGEGEDGIETEQDVINPKVLHLCLQVHPSVPDQQKLSAQTMLGELDVLGDLTPADWMYVQTNGYYKSVKNLAKKQLAHLVEETEVVEKPAPVKKAKKTTKVVEPTEVEE